MNFEINITAYRYSKYPNELILDIRKVLPYAFIRVWDNSSDKLDIHGANEHRWNRFNPSLSRVWNWAIAQSQTEWLMITNDDIKFRNDWYSNLMDDMDRNPEALWHGPSRCFLFNTKLISRVGWFDEAFTGFTYEDLDYVRRMNHLYIKKLYGTDSSLIRNAQCLKDEIRTERVCAPFNNVSHFKAKYDNHNTEDFHCKPNLPTPNYYPCLKFQ